MTKMAVDIAAMLVAAVAIAVMGKRLFARGPFYYFLYWH